MARTAKEVADEFYQRTQSIRADARLSDAGKKGKLARAYLKAKDEFDTARSNATQAKTERRSTLERQLFGIPPTGSDVLIYRDAQDRAAQITDPNEAAALLARAQRSGDTSLAQAIAARAYDSLGDQLAGGQWLGVLSTYSDTRPVTTPLIQEAVDLIVSPTAELNSLFYQDGVVSRPPELPRDDRQVAALAEQLGVDA